MATPIGTCSCCGGVVLGWDGPLSEVPKAMTVPRCRSCGATKSSGGVDQRFACLGRPSNPAPTPDYRLSGCDSWPGAAAHLRAPVGQPIDPTMKTPDSRDAAYERVKEVFGDDIRQRLYGPKWQGGQLGADDGTGPGRAEQETDGTGLSYGDDKVESEGYNRALDLVGVRGFHEASYSRGFVRGRVAGLREAREAQLNAEAEGANSLAGYAMGYNEGLRAGIEATQKGLFGMSDPAASSTAGSPK